MSAGWSSSFSEQVLQAHNRFREQHGSPHLLLSKELSEQAQSWAEKLAKKGHVAFCELPGIGENITFFPLTIDGEKVVEHWYSEHVKYEYEAPGWQAGTNYFTQVVWKATEEIGVGRALTKVEGAHTNEDLSAIEPSANEQVVVVLYRPGGNNNRTGQFAANVHKPKIVETQKQ